jgi:hypothetical protein
VGEQQALVQQRTAWLAAHGFQQNYTAIRAFVTPAFITHAYPHALPQYRAELDTRMEFKAQELAMLYSIDSIRQFQKHGIDVVRAYLMDSPETTVADYLLRTETVVIGSIITINPHTRASDGLASTITIHVHEVLKGDPSLKTIRLRQRSGIDPSGVMEMHGSDLFAVSYTNPASVAPEQRYLFFVSHTLYRLRALNHPARGGPYYIDVLSPRRIVGGRVLPPANVSVGGVMPTSVQEVRNALISLKKAMQ